MAYVSLGQYDETPDDYVDVDDLEGIGARWSKKLRPVRMSRAKFSPRKLRSGGYKLKGGYGASPIIPGLPGMDLDGLDQFDMMQYLKNPLVLGGIALVLFLVFMPKKKR